MRHCRAGSSVRRWMGMTTAHTGKTYLDVQQEPDILIRVRQRQELQQVLESWHSLMRCFQRLYFADLLPCAIDQLIVLTETSLHVGIMREHHDVVLCQMHVGFDGVCADLCRAFECAHCILRVIRLVSAMCNCLWHVLAGCCLPCKRP